jgi:group II intron reverse transcriptase/maturase
MQNAETVLSVLRERGRRGLPLERLYRQLFNPQLYLLAYGRIYANHGAMTPGVSQETADGMSVAKIGRIIDAMRHERYRFKPVRRVHVPKKDGKPRPLGLPTWSDKLVGEVVRLLLEAYYEPTFSDRSHGYRPGRGCHTALREVATSWTGTTWFIEGDISDCFGSLDHQVMTSILAEKIHDGRFLRLVSSMLTAGYLQDWVWHQTLSGAPQGGVVSPILSNIYLHRLDTFVETVLVPQHTRGRLRARNPAYRKVEYAIVAARRRGDRTQVRSLFRQLHRLPSQDLTDPGYRRLRYCRYADDTLLGFVGPKAEAEQVTRRLAQFLRDELNLELSPAKTLITHARSQRARFLGYQISVSGSNRVTRRPTATDRRYRRSVNGTVTLHVPKTVITAKTAPYLERGKPTRRPPLLNADDYTIVAKYGAEYRGIVQYYLLAGNVARLHRLEWVMQTSLLKTLASKHRSTVTKTAAKHRAKILTPHGPRTCFEATIARDGRKPLVARFGGIPLIRQKTATIIDRQPARPIHSHKELITRLLRGRCEICQSTGTVQVHQIRKLADPAQTGPTPPAWKKLMASKRRKTLVVCDTCHEQIHATPTTPTLT